MKEKTATITELKKQLGSDYTIKNIDLAKCLYRNFGNSFDVEIRGAESIRKNRKVDIYLWFVDPKRNCIMVKKKYGVKCTAEEIDRTVENLYEYSLFLIGKDLRDINKLRDYVYSTDQALTGR